MPVLINQGHSKITTPFIEGDTATFTWRGRTPPRLEGDFTGWDPNQAIKLDRINAGEWNYRLSLPSDAYIEYRFSRGDKSILDPQNPRKTTNGLGGYNNYFSMPEYKMNELSRYDRDIPHGVITSYSLTTEDIIPSKSRVIRLYQPPTTEAVPLMVVWDGQDNLRRLRLNNIIDKLIYQKRIRPIALAFVNNGGQRSRMIEYACSDATLFFLMIKVMPLAKREINLIDIDTFPGAYGVTGASLGGLMALYTGIRIPHIFGKVLSQSGAFSSPDFDSVVFDIIQGRERKPVNIWMDVGVYDLAGLLESNRKMLMTLQQKGYPVTYREYNSGHSYPAWRDDIWRGLEALFGTGI